RLKNTSRRSSASDRNPRRELQLARRPRAHRTAKERRAERADVAPVIDAVEQIEGVESQRDGALAVLVVSSIALTVQLQLARDAKVQRCVAGAAQRVSSHAGRSRAPAAVVEDILAEELAVRTWRIHRQADADVGETPRAQAPEQQEAMRPVEI